VNSGGERKRDDLTINFRILQFHIGKLFIQKKERKKNIISDSEGILSDHLKVQAISSC